MKKVRESNFELLRILCMLGVLGNHIMQYLYDLHTPSITWAGEARIFLMNICIIAVNCFILISGYFGIRLSTKGVIKFISQCFFYSVGIYLLMASFHGTFSFPGLVKSFFACSESPLWFIPTYLALMLVSPLINAGFEGMDQLNRVKSLCLLLLADVYIGYMHQCEAIGSSGYNLFHMICIYYLGRVISMLPKYPFVKWGWLSLLMFLIMTVLHAVKMRFFPISIIYSMHYNSPCLYLASFLVFQWFRNLSFQSSFINYTASSVLAVYLIHCHPEFWQYFSWMLKQVLSFVSFNEPIAVVIFVVLFFTAAIIVDKIRIFLTRNMENWVSSSLAQKNAQIS